MSHVGRVKLLRTPFDGARYVVNVGRSSTAVTSSEQQAHSNALGRAIDDVLRAKEELVFLRRVGKAYQRRYAAGMERCAKDWRVLVNASDDEVLAFVKGKCIDVGLNVDAGVSGD